MNFLRRLANIFLLLVGIEYFTVGVLVSLIPLVGGLALWAGLFLTYFGVVPAQLVSYFSPFKFTHNNFFGIENEILAVSLGLVAVIGGLLAIIGAKKLSQNNKEGFVIWNSLVVLSIIIVIWNIVWALSQTSGSISDKLILPAVSIFWSALYYFSLRVLKRQQAQLVI